MEARLYLENIELNEKHSTSTILLSQVGESPHITESNSISDGGKHKLKFAVPGFSGVVAFWLEFGFVLRRHHVHGHGGLRADISHVKRNVSRSIAEVHVTIIDD